MLLLVLVPLLVGLSLLGQRPVAALLRVKAPVRPLWPFAPGTPFWSQLAVRAAGLFVTFCVVVAVGFAQFSREQRVTSRVEVVPGLAAARGGVESGDVVVAVDGVPVKTFSELREAMLGVSPVKQLSVSRGGSIIQRTVNAQDGVLGVRPAGEALPSAPGRALRSALRFPFVLGQILADAPRTAAVAPPREAVWALFGVAEAWWLCVLLEAMAFVVNGLARL